MESIGKLMLDKITALLKRFSVNELQHLNKILIRNLDWNYIARTVTENRYRMNVGNVVSIINDHLIGGDRELIRNTYYRVLLADAVYHHRSQWRTVIVDKINGRLLNKAIIMHGIRYMLDTMQIDGITYVMKCDDLFAVSIDIVGSETGVKLTAPHVFAVASGNGSSLVFYKSRRIVNLLMNVVVGSVGAKKFQPYPLTGKNIRSMVDILEDRDEKENNTQILVTKDTGTDIQQLYFNKRRILDRFTIHAQSFRNRNNDNNSNSGHVGSVGKIDKFKIELKASSVTNGHRDMILTAVLTPPYPDWVTNLPFLGTNSITLS